MKDSSSNKQLPFIDNCLNDNMSGFRKGHSTATILMAMRDDIKSAMKKGELTLMLLADFSKAFDTINFKTVLKKLHRLNFSHGFLYWITSYLTNRFQYVQIDDKKSNLTPVCFGVPQGSILGPFIFNLYVSDVDVPQTCYQYADDTSLYEHCKTAKLDQSIDNMQQSLDSLNHWSSLSNLSLNPKKTKSMLFSTAQMSRTHSLDKVKLDLICANQEIKRETATKLLGVIFTDHLNWNEHIKYLTSSCCAVLAVLRKLKHMAPYNLRKQLVEMLVISKLDYCDTVYSPVHDYQLKRLQRIQNACAGFVKGSYAKVADVINIGWLPIKERRDWHMLKMAHKALHQSPWPAYLSLKIQSSERVLRSSAAKKLQVPLESGTFQDTASQLFNALPAELRNCEHFGHFSRQCKDFLMCNARDKYFT